MLCFGRMEEIGGGSGGGEGGGDVDGDLSGFADTGGDEGAVSLMDMGEDELDGLFEGV